MPRQVKTLLGCLAVLVLAVAALWFANHNATAPSSETASVLEGGDPEDPMNGDEANDDENAPPVREGGFTATWAELNALLGDDESYKECVGTTISAGWDVNIPRFIESEKSEPVLFILAINTTASEETIRATALEGKGKDGIDVSDLEIVHTDEITNTRGFGEGRCETFTDKRSQVRLSLGVFEYDADGNPTGLEDDRGVFGDCHNPWIIEDKESEPSTTPSTPGDTPTTSPPPDDEGKNPEEGSDPQGNSGDGGGLNSGTGEYSDPDDMEHPGDDPHENPDPPGGDDPPDDPSEPVNDGTVPEDGGTTCNPDFQDC